jgi:hypothetical protein
MNTRTYSRDSRLAFPNHCDYACAVERPARKGRWVKWAALLALAYGFALLTARN